jgi:hypothetical protein
MRPSTPKCSDSFVASAAASIATGWNEPVPGRELHPLKSSAFHGALFRQLGNCSTAQTDIGPVHDAFISALVRIATNRLHFR